MGIRGTYRVQFHAGFGFDDAAAVVDYLDSLGVSHLYCSPYLQADAGSTHGYDVVDHSKLNAELGGAQAHDRLTEALGRAGMSQVLDIVPNHMARDGRANRWWWDVLENGPASRYARFFDIEWAGPDDKSQQTVLVPVLGDHYGRILEAGELQLVREGGRFVISYHEHELPVSPRSVDDLLAAAAKAADSAELAEISDGFGWLPHGRLDADAARERQREQDGLCQRLDRLCRDNTAVAVAVVAEADRIGSNPDALDRLLCRQNFRLALWRIASEELDYRRFFNIETLIGLRIEDEDAFAATHELVLDLVARGVIEGLRIDHVDGLLDPEGYLHRLRRAGGGVYTVVEKILEPGEELPGEWPVEGTSGYDFITAVNNLFVDAAGEAAMSEVYEHFSGESADYPNVVLAAKQQIMRQELATEVDRLSRGLAEVCDGHRRHRDHTRRELREALREVIAAFEVYRTYAQPDRRVSTADREHVHAAIETARARRPDIDTELLTFIGELLVLGHPGRPESRFALRFAQVSAPVMAKGVEDTAFYRFQRLISLNEVGGDPGVFGRPVEDFHAGAAGTAQRWPQAMLTLSTHDTKRSADTRARIHLLAEMPQEWAAAANRWSELTARHKTDPWPDRNAEYLLYQTLVGAWPLDTERVLSFMEKATREAKVHTSWIDPVPEYDEALARFVTGTLADRAFTQDLETFLAEHQVVELGRVTSLAQTTLLLTCPGVPDVYQGSEVWDYSLVDPDNRRPVDYAGLRALLIELDGASEAAQRAWERVDEGGPKLWLVHRLLAHRRGNPQMFAEAGYEPLPVTGARADHAVAFHRGGEFAVLVPRLAAGLAGDWKDTTVTLPAGRWTDLLTGAAHDGGPTEVATLAGIFPVVVLSKAGA